VQRTGAPEEVALGQAHSLVLHHLRLHLLQPQIWVCHQKVMYRQCQKKVVKNLCQNQKNHQWTMKKTMKKLHSKQFKKLLVNLHKKLGHFYPMKKMICRLRILNMLLILFYQH